MKFNKFYINIFLRIITIILFCFVFVYFIEKEDSLLTSGFIVFLILAQIIYLIKYVNKTNRELAEFLIHLQQGDTSVLFSKENIENTFKGLRNSFEKINVDIQNIRTEKEQKSHYLKYVIDNINTGLLAFNESGEVEFVNKQAKLFLNRESLRLFNINNLDEEFIKVLNETTQTESTILKKTINDEFFYLSFTLSEFKIDKKKIKLFTIQDVRQEIESNEIESWQKLTSVLTHEMMNSLTPITSLAHAVKSYLKTDDQILTKSEISDELIQDIAENADIIENRSKGLLEFINNYRNITKLPKPKFEILKVEKLIQNSIQLFQDIITEKQIKINVDINPTDLTLEADKGMIEQVIINLLKNAIEAISEISNPQISINAFMVKSQKRKIEVIDNGKGIMPENMENIFIPFYTTKENGSGVGLSLSRQILKLHKASIHIDSELNAQTKVTLVF